MTVAGSNIPFTRLAIPVIAMMAVVAASNVLVQHPVEQLGLQDFLTWGAFTYPLAFLVNDLTNRRFGPAGARRVVYAGFDPRGAAVDLAGDAAHRARLRHCLPVSASCSISACSIACAG